LALLLALAVCASSMAYFFDDPDPRVALSAFAAWGLFIVAIFKVGQS
jgi:hypothetical protein